MHYTIGGPANESSRKQFKCKKGHITISNVAITIAAFGSMKKDKPVCPVCIAEFVEENFGAEEVETVVTRAVQAVPIAAPTFTPCATEGCILAAHPEGLAHINQQRKEF